MMREEFETELKRTACISPEAKKDTEIERRGMLVEELWRKFGPLNALTWREAVTWVIDHHKTRSVPIPAEFESALAAIQKNTYSGASEYTPPSKEETHVWLMERVHKLTPRGAVFIIREWGRSPWLSNGLPQEYVDAVIEISSGYQEPEKFGNLNVEMSAVIADIDEPFV